MKTRAILAAVCSLLLAACTGSTEYLEFRRVDEKGWSEDSALCFTVPVQDTSALYDILIHIRHTERYPYQNMWLFIDNADRRDTIEFYLADDYGVWLGQKGMGHISMPVLFEQAYRFDSVGSYTFSVRHGMRQQPLKGVTDVGLELLKSSTQSPTRSN